MAAVCERISKGQLVKTAAKAEGVTPTLVRQWALADEFATVYARARESQAHAMAEDALTVADKADAENAQAIRIRVDARKWLASKIAPRHYGDKMDVTSDNKPLAAPQTIIIGGQTVTF